MRIEDSSCAAARFSPIARANCTATSVTTRRAIADRRDAACEADTGRIRVFSSRVRLVQALALPFSQTPIFSIALLQESFLRQAPSKRAKAASTARSVRATTSPAFRWAPPSGSATISSTIPKRRKSSAVNFNRAAASSAFLGIRPKDRGATLGRSDGVRTILQHKDMIGDRKRRAHRRNRLRRRSLRLLERAPY